MSASASVPIRASILLRIAFASDQRPGLRRGPKVLEEGVLTELRIGLEAEVRQVLMLLAVQTRGLDVLAEHRLAALVVAHLDVVEVHDRCRAREGAGEERLAEEAETAVTGLDEPDLEADALVRGVVLEHDLVDPPLVDECYPGRAVHEVLRGVALAGDVAAIALGRGVLKPAFDLGGGGPCPLETPHAVGLDGLKKPTSRGDLG